MVGVSEAYEATDFYDWRLLEFTVRYSDPKQKVHEIVVEIGEPQTMENLNADRRFGLVFSEVRGFHAEIDLIIKSRCSDAISEEGRLY